MTTPGTLYVVATPIGNLADISLRALDILKKVDVIAAEDTRHSKLLLNHHLITTRLISYHQHNERAQAAILIERLLHGESIALITDAGTPLISDPGSLLVQEAYRADIKVVPIPGACAAISALSVSGLSAERFSFEGFLPAKTNDRKKYLELLQHETRTLIFYEAPHRIVESITAMSDIFGATRLATIARELTKTFETTKQAPLGELKNWLLQDNNQQKGEFVIVIAGREKSLDDNLQLAITIVEKLATKLSTTEAVKLAADITGVRKNLLYDLALGKK